MYSVINHVVNLYGLMAISIHPCCTFNMSMGVMCVLQSWVLPRYCINLCMYFIYYLHEWPSGPAMLLMECRPSESAFMFYFFILS